MFSWLQAPAHVLTLQLVPVTTLIAVVALLNHLLVNANNFQLLMPQTWIADNVLMLLRQVELLRSSVELAMP